MVRNGTNSDNAISIQTMATRTIVTQKMVARNMVGMNMVTPNMVARNLVTPNMEASWPALNWSQAVYALVRLHISQG